MNPEQIKYLRHEEIDLRKWDRCIENSLNRLPYAASWYLDRLTERWDGLVFGDYLYVMPLPRSKKMGINYLLQPVFIQQLGIFSPLEAGPELVNRFLESIPGKFRLIRLNLNPANFYTGSCFTTKRNTNYVLNLELPYRQIYRGYPVNTRRNIVRARNNNLEFRQIHDIAGFIQLLEKFYRSKTNAVKEKHLSMLQSLISFTSLRGSGKIYGVYSARNSLCAAAFFLQSMNRHIYLASASTPEGHESRAMFLLIDRYISENAERKELLDFEGSNIAGIARFFAGFGAVATHYCTISRNMLPWPLKLIRK